MAQDFSKGKTSMRSMASRVSHLGAAKSGTADLWLMRVTAVALLFLAIGFICIVLSLVGKDLPEVKAQFAHPFVSIVMLLFILAAVFHMKTGMQSIIDDYIQSPHAKEWVMIGNIFFSAFVGVAAIFAVLKLSGV